MDENELTKTELWIERIKDFYASGLSRKEWCQKHQVSLSTFGYWIRKQTKKPTEPAQTADPVFARLPSKQEISSDFLSGHSPVMIHLSENVRIEVGKDCPCELLASLIHTFKTYA